MGRIITPRYRVEIADGFLRKALGLESSTSWDPRRHGPANDQSLERYVFRYAQGFEHGGPNFRISRRLGFVPYPREARIVDQRTGRTVASWKAGLFQVWGAVKL